MRRRRRRQRWHCVRRRRRSLPFLSRTEAFLYPVVGVVLLFAASIVLAALGVRVNATRAVAHLYFL
jgi:hypothetical protein